MALTLIEYGWQWQGGMPSTHHPFQVTISHLASLVQLEDPSRHAIALASLTFIVQVSGTTYTKPTFFF